MSEDSRGMDGLKMDQVEIKDGMKEMTRKADIFMLVILWAHLPFASFIATSSYGTWKEGLIASLFICIMGTISFYVSRGTFAHRLLNGLLLLAYSVVLISVQFGRIEMHFHVFVELPFLILYRDWRIIPPAALFIAFHHVLFNFCQSNNLTLFGFPLIAFNYRSGWDIVILHALFVIFECLVLVYFSEVLRKQYLEVYSINLNLEGLVEARTLSLKVENEKVKAYKKALDQVAITVLTDENGIIVDVNENFENISEYSRDELIGKNHRIVNSAYHSREFFAAMWSTIKAGKAWRGEIRNKSKSGKNYWIDTAISPIRDGQNKIINFLAIRFDITSKKESDILVEKQREQIISQSKLSALGEMAGGIAHEINNPLAIISSTIRTIRKMAEKDLAKTEDFKDALEDIDSVVLRISKIISGLRNVSRDAENEVFDECQVCDILDDVLSLCSEKFKMHGISVEIDVIPIAI